MHLQSSKSAGSIGEYFGLDKINPIFPLLLHKQTVKYTHNLQEMLWYI